MLEEMGRINHLIDMMGILRETIRNADRANRVFKDELDELQTETIELMHKLGLKKAGTEKMSVSLSTEDTPSADPEQWQEIWKWIDANGYNSLIPKKLNAAPWRELKLMGIDVPHVGTFTKTKVSLTKVRGG